MRKYQKGMPIMSLEQFANAQFIWDARTNKVYHCGFFQSWQFRYVKIGVQNGWFYKAIRIGEKNGRITTGNNKENTR